MANRSFLICTDAPAPDHDPIEPGDSARVAGTYTIPVLWLSLFTRGDVVQRALPGGGEGGAASYPLLVTSLAAAKSLFARRRPHLARTMPATLAPVIDEWAQLVDQLDGDYVKLETYEIWAMDEEDFVPYLEKIQGLMDDLETAKPEEVAAFLADRQIGADPRASAGYRNTGATLLRGHRWRRPVPWKD